MGDTRVDSSGGVVAISGQATVANADEVKQALREASADDRDVTVDLASLEGFDFSLLQLLVSATRTGSGTLRFAPGCPDSVRRALVEGGFVAHLGECFEPPIWMS